MSSRDYWARRAEAAMDAVQGGADIRLARIGRAMMAAQDTLTEEAERILGNYMKRYGLTREEAKAYLEKPVSRAEWNRLLARVGTMPEGREKREMLAKMSSGAYRYRITRAEALRANIAIETAKAAQTVEDETTGQLKWTAAEAYQRSMFDAQAREGVGFAAPNLQGALEAVGAYWAAGNYTDSCWTDKACLAEALEEQISESFLSGKSYARMARAIQDEFGVSFRKAERLVRTETSYVAGQSRKKAYQDIGWKTYVFITALDKRTCDKCGDLNTNQSLPLDKAEVGVNYPPIHPNCRCTIISEPPNSNAWRVGFDANEKRVKLPKDMAYAEWKAWQAAGCPEDVEAWRLQKSGANATIRSQGSDEMNIRAPISSPIEQRNTGKGNPNAILVSGQPLNNRQQRLLERLPDYDARATFHKRDVNMRDLSALTAETGCEYAMFTKGGERLIVRGNEWMTNISPEDAREMAVEGWRWSGHTHPGESDFCLWHSDGDLTILRAFSQGQSVIYNSRGRYLRFYVEEGLI